VNGPDLIPIAVVDRDGERRVEWCDMHGIPPDDSFFGQTVARALADPHRRATRQFTPLATLAVDVGSDESCSPSGFVFHMSRCGSTLAAHLLRATGTTLVLSEPEPLDALLRIDAEAAPADRSARLRAMLAALARMRGPQQQHVVVKLDAWAVFEFDAIRAAFPEVPWIFLYREPADVLASQVRRPGSHMVLGAAAGRMSTDEGLAMGRERYSASVLARIVGAALEQADDPQGRFVSYADLPGAVADVIAPWFWIEVAATARATMADVVQWDAHTPSLPFTGSEPASVDVARAASILTPLHRDLEVLAGRAA